MSAELKAARRDAALILTLSNPGKRNALDPGMAAAVIETLTTAERDDSIRAVVLTGADGFFCGGNDLSRLLDSRLRDDSGQLEEIDALNGLIEAMLDCPKPIIAAVEGGAAGAGFSLALASDFIIAGASALFAMPHGRLALTPEGGSSWFLARSLPRQLAAEICLLGLPIDAQRLAVAGLINAVVPDGLALDAALARADELAELSASTVERIKSLLREAPVLDLSHQLQNERMRFAESLRHCDAAEGIPAYLEQRKPVFR